MLAIATCCVAFAGCNLSFTMVDGYSFDRTGETAEFSDDGEFSEGITEIKIINKFGDVKIASADGEPGWSWNSKVWADTQELADLYIDDLAMEVDTVGNTQTWTIVMPEASSDLNGVESNLTLRIPDGVETKLENRHGNVMIRNLSSRVDLKNAHGDIDVKSVTGKLEVVNAHGKIDANQIGEGVFKNSHGNTDVRDASANVTIKSSHGRVKAEQIQGDLNFDGSHSNLVADTSGNVTASNSHGSNKVITSGARTRIDSSHGNIDLTLYSGSFDSIELETSHSSIHVMLPASCEPAIVMDTSHGSSKSEFESNPSSKQVVNLKNRHGNIKVSKSQVIAEVAE